MKRLIKYMFFVAIGIGSSFAPIYAQSNEEKAKVKEDKVKALVESRAFTFLANSAQPLNATEINQVMGQMQGLSGGSQINLAEKGYKVTLTKELVTSQLPYYGRAFSAPIGNSDRAGYNFDSKDFTITQKTSKKGELLLSITPKDQRESIRMQLNISKSGMAFLTISSNARQTITYNGFIADNDVKN